MSASVLVRTYNSASTIRAALDSLVAQTVPPRIVVVDSGSTDATLDIVAEYGCDVVMMAPGTYSHGRALNLGADHVTTDVVFAMSSHVVAPSTDWVERSLVHYVDPAVLATCGLPDDVDGSTLHGPRRQDLALARAFPRWGMANTAASWRRSVFRQHRFNEDLEACEDKEWALRALGGGGVIVVDPALAVLGTHRRSAGLRAYVQRVRRENRALLGMGVLPFASPAELARDWWGAVRARPAGERGVTSLTKILDRACQHLAQRDLSRARHAQPAVLATLVGSGDAQWRREVDEADAQDQRIVPFILRTAWRARRYRALILVGSLGRSDLYRDLLIGVIVRRVTNRNARLVITDCTWTPGSARWGRLSALRRLSAALHAAAVRALDGPRTTFCVLSRTEAERFPRTWHVDPGHVAVTPFMHTLWELDTLRPTQQGYLFAGGDSMRDYPALLDAARGVPLTFIVATRQPLTHVPANAAVQALSHEEFISRLSGAEAVVVPLRDDGYRSAGQQTYFNAMALGKVTIVTDAPGVRDVLTDGWDCLVSPTGATGLRATFARYLEMTGPEREAMGERARRTVLGRYTDEHYRRRLLDLAQGRGATDLRAELTIKTPQPARA